MPPAVRPAAPLCYARMLIRAQRRHQASIGGAAVDSLRDAAPRAPLSRSARESARGAATHAERAEMVAMQ